MGGLFRRLQALFVTTKWLEQQHTKKVRHENWAAKRDRDAPSKDANKHIKKNNRNKIKVRDGCLRNWVAKRDKTAFEQMSLRAWVTTRHKNWADKTSSVSNNYIKKKNHYTSAIMNKHILKSVPPNRILNYCPSEHKGRVFWVP